MNPIDILGYVATALLAIAFIPQTVKVWQTKSVEDISALTFSIVLMATILWMTYGWIKQDWPLVAVNIIMFGTQGSILLCKFKYQKK